VHPLFRLTLEGAPVVLLAALCLSNAGVADATRSPRIPTAIVPNERQTAPDVDVDANTKAKAPEALAKVALVACHDQAPSPQMAVRGREFGCEAWMRISTGAPKARAAPRCEFVAFSPVSLSRERAPAGPPTFGIAVRRVLIVAPSVTQGGRPRSAHAVGFPGYLECDLPSARQLFT
jgi:hypothetical protein